LFAGQNKYETRTTDERISRIIGEGGHIAPLVTAAYADSTWSKILSALNLFEKFQKSLPHTVIWPLTIDILSDFVHWATFTQKLTPSTVNAYICHIKLVHKLRKLDFSACESFELKAHIRGAKNLNFYNDNTRIVKKAMTLPLLTLTRMAYLPLVCRMACAI